MKFLRALLRRLPRPSRAKTRRVVITGIGVVSPLGVGKESFWQGLVEGRSGVRPITRFDASSFPSQIAAEVPDFNLAEYLTEEQIKALPRSAQLALIASHLAKKDAGIPLFDPFRTDVLCGAGSISFEFVDDQVFSNPSAGKEFVPGTFESRGLGKYNINTPACAIAHAEGVRGFVSTISTACASGLTALGLGFDRIRAGLAESSIVAATDCAVNHFTLNLFASAGFLSTANDDPAHALCPFDLRRTRSVLGEGACVLILEEREHARLRGATAYAEIRSYHQEYENVDALFRTDRSGSRWADAIREALRRAGLREGPELVNAHATSDIDLDTIEATAISSSVTGRGTVPVPVTSIKGAIGSPFAAAGMLQVAATALSISNHTLIPTANYLIPDPAIGLTVVKAPGPSPRVKSALVNAHAYGGVNAAMILSDAR